MATLNVVDQSTSPVAAELIAVDRPVLGLPTGVTPVIAQVVGVIGVGAGPTHGQLFPVGNH